jgi:DNA mismatch endonuclease (patch repair protein)
MADILSPERRSKNMSRISSKNTKPELIVRSLVHSLGFRYRLHVKSLPGKPDLVFRQRKKVIFVHGCFWHQHASCREGRVPCSRQEYWQSKLTKNVERDTAHTAQLAAAGWKTLIVWECEMKNRAELGRQLSDFLSEKAQQKTRKV